METPLDQAIHKLKVDVLHMMHLAQDAVRKAVASLLDHNAALAREVIDADRELNDYECRVDSESLKILALHHPVAKDLRFIVGSMRMLVNIERLGDETGHDGAVPSAELGGTKADVFDRPARDLRNVDFRAVGGLWIPCAGSLTPCPLARVSAKKLSTESSGCAGMLMPCTQGEAPGPSLSSVTRKPAREASRAAMAPLIDLLNTHLSTRTWLLGERFTMADIPVACDVHRWWGLPQERTARPHLERWFQALRERPGARGVLDQPLS